MSSERIHDAVLCAERRGRTPARSIGAAIVTELVYGCNCRSANGNTATVRQSSLYSSLNRMVLRLHSGERYSVDFVRYIRFPNISRHLNL